MTSHERQSITLSWGDAASIHDVLDALVMDGIHRGVPSEQAVEARRLLEQALAALTPEEAAASGEVPGEAVPGSSPEGTIA